MKLNIDQIKESLQKTKEYVANELNELENEEIDIFIDDLIASLIEKIDKIDMSNLSGAIKQYIEEDSNV